MSNNLNADIVILGGGVAGLWTAAYFKQAGFHPILVETHELGGLQSIHSQGIIHGGMKYALNGFLNKASEAIKSMPSFWGDALKGQGPIDLTGVEVLSPHQYLWSNQQLSNRISSFFASFALKSRVRSVSKDKYPQALQSESFRGNCYQLEEMVLNIPSLVQHFAKQLDSHLLKVNPFDSSAFRYDETGDLSRLTVQSQNTEINISAKAFILTAGSGNQSLIDTLESAPLMQKRPLHMVSATMPGNLSFYAHLIEADATPRLTITSHPTFNEQTTWYIGGKLAEEGVQRSTEEQIAYAKEEMALALPHLDFSKATWRTLRVDRAEGLQKNGKRPDLPVIENRKNIWAAWPTKLAFSPLLAKNILESVKKKQITPIDSMLDLSRFEKPMITKPFWETT